MIATLLFSHGAVPSSANAASPRFEVEGDLDITYYPIGNRKLSNHTTPFRVLVDDSKVVIKTIGFDTAPVEFWEFATDGTNTHFLEKRKDDSVITNRYDFQTREFVPLKTPLRPANRAVLTLSTTPTPTMVGAITPVWLAYGSQRYFQSRKSGEELDSDSIFLLVLPEDEERVRDTAFWKWAEANPAFLERLACQRLDLRFNRTAILAEAVTNATFSVTQWTNAGFATFPMRFELRLFMEPASPTVTTIVVGTAKRIVPLARRLSDLLPAQLPYPTWVIDERVRRAGRKGGPLTYHTKDGKIMTLEEAKAFVASNPALRTTPKQ